MVKGFRVRSRPITIIPWKGRGGNDSQLLEDGSRPNYLNVIRDKYASNNMITPNIIAMQLIISYHRSSENHSKFPVKTV